VFKKVKRVLHRELTNGLNLKGCSAAIGCAFTIGIFPIIGFATPLNTAAALTLRLNQPIVQGINWIMGPLKLLLIIPFLRLGEWLFAVEPFSLSLKEFSRIFFDDWLATTREFAWTFAHAITGWLVAAPLIYVIIYFLAKAILSRRVVDGKTAGMT